MPLTCGSACGDRWFRTGTGSLKGSGVGAFWGIRCRDSGLPTDAGVLSRAARDIRSLGNPVHRITGMAYRGNGGCKSFRWGGELHHHFTPAVHGPQSAPPDDRHQGWHDHPMHTGEMKWKLTARGPGLVGIRLDQVLGVVFSPIRMRLKTRKRPGLGAICEHQGPDTAGGSTHHRRPVRMANNVLT